jgi:allene oxide cyclase
MVKTVWGRERVVSTLQRQRGCFARSTLAPFVDPSGPTGKEEGMRRIWLVSGLTCGFILGAVAISLAGGAGGSVDSPTTIHVVERITTDRVIDVGKQGDSTGDLLTFHNVLYDETNSDPVGRDQGDCVRIAPHAGTWECRWTSWIAGMGSLTVEGQFNDSRETVFAITGGTKMFRNAHGTMELGFRNNPAELDFIFHVIP